MNIEVSEITKNERNVARKSFQAINQTLTGEIQGVKGNILISIEGSEESVSIPKKAFFVLGQALKNMAEGKGFNLLLTNETIGTQEAAGLLNISRPHLVKLLEKGDIPFIKVGKHRRVLRKDILAFEKKQKIVRNKSLNFLAKQAQELKLGYE